ncbi:MAG: gamma-glutamylcyclotransferase family protein [Nevskiales bacterium]
MQRVFVYGTLRRGESHAHLMQDAEYLGLHVTEPRYTLCDMGEYPAAVSWGVTSIRGEVYDVDDALLRRLDEYEEFPGVYNRRLVHTPYGGAWIYLILAPPVVSCVIGHGDWCRRDQFDFEE